MVKVALIQMACSRDKKKSLAKALSLMEQAVKKKAEVICLPELFLTDYFCKTEDPALFDLAEPLEGPTTKELQSFAKKHKVIVLGSIFEKRAKGLYHNTSTVIDEAGKLIGVYRKMHIPHDPGFNEKYYFTPGDLGFKSFETKKANIGTLICWDQWYPEGARITALKGAEILVYPTAIGAIPEDGAMGKVYLDAWVNIQVSHAIANGLFVVAVNRVGKEADTVFWGNSFVADPYGRIIARAGTKEEVLVVNCDLALIEEKRRIWPHFRDRRIDAYKDILKRYDK
jgi:N-carbamoylputrescine amidase